MAYARFKGALAIGLLLLAGCGSGRESRVDDGIPLSTSIATTQMHSQDSVESPHERVWEGKAEGNLPREEAKDKEDRDLRYADLPYSQNISASEAGAGVPFSGDTRKIEMQLLLDSALDLCEASNDLWEQNDLEGAVDTLDEAYSLILQADDEDCADLLQQKEDIRFTISKRLTEIYASRNSVGTGAHNAIPLVMNGEVRKALDLFRGTKNKFFLSAYRRSGKYRSDIVHALKEAGLPEELSWLPLIESGFNLRALSRARALGIWQFIASTGYRYGLIRDRWIDERMDPKKSTRAAIAYFKNLHEIFGDWTTVLAAYNCGEWAVLRQIKTQKINYLDNFWDLYEKLPKETAFYVPMFLAVLHIMKDPSAHGIELPPLEKPMDVEEVTIAKQVHLKTIAEYLDVDFDTLKDLNAELRQYLTPDESYSLVVPAGTGQVLISRLKDLPAWRHPVPDYVVHNIRKGDSLSLLARKYRTSVGAITAANGLKRNQLLKVGQSLKIPSGKTGSRQAKSASQLSEQRESVLRSYEVKRGDSLWRIAKSYGTTTRAIRSANRLKTSQLRVGQALRVPVGLKPSGPENTKTHYVRKGDSPCRVAQKYEMSLVELLRLNSLTPRCAIYPGQKLIVRAQ